MTAGTGCRARARIAGVTSLAVTVGACAGSARAASEPASVADGAMVTSPAEPCELGRAPLTLPDGSYLYVEPEQVLPLASDLLVVGTPTYTWTAPVNGPFARGSADAHLAARFTLEGRATAIEKPMDVEIGDVRVAPLGGDRWAVVFDEIDQDSLPARYRAAAIWYAEHDGDGWSTLERVPDPDRGMTEVWSSSELVSVGDTLVWVAPARLPSGESELLQYERADGRWRSEVISRDLVERAALAYDPGSGLWMAHFSEDPGIPDWQQSLRLYRRTAGWELVSRVTVVEPGARVTDPAVMILPDGVTVSWRMEGRADTGAYALVGIGAGGRGTLLSLDPRALQVVALRPTGAGPAWLVTHVASPERGPELKVLRSLPGGGAERVAAMPIPYQGGFVDALWTTRDEVVVLGAELSLVPEQSFLRSLLLRLSTSCT